MGEFHLTPDERVIVFYAKEYETSDHKVSGLLDHISVNKYSLEKNQSYDTIITDAKELSIGFLFEKAFDKFPFFNEYEETDMDEIYLSFFSDKFINFIKSTLENNNIENLNIDLLTCNNCYNDLDTNKDELNNLIYDSRIRIRYTDNYLGYSNGSYNWELNKYNSHLNLDQRLNLIGLYFNSSVVDWKDHLGGIGLQYTNGSSRTYDVPNTINNSWADINLSSTQKSTLKSVSFTKPHQASFAVSYSSSRNNGRGIFEGFPKLETITFQTIPFGHKYTIGERAFKNNPKLRNISLSSSIDVIPSRCFMDCTSLTTISLSKVETIHNDAFNGSALKSVILTNIETIGDGCFRDCTLLISVTLPKNQSKITGLSHHMFRGCTRLSQILIPTSFTSLGNNCFRDCTNLN